MTVPLILLHIGMLISFFFFWSRFVCFLRRLKLQFFLNMLVWVCECCLTVDKPDKLCSTSVRVNNWIRNNNSDAARTIYLPPRLALSFIFLLLATSGRSSFDTIVSTNGRVSVRSVRFRVASNRIKRNLTQLTPFSFFSVLSLFGKRILSIFVSALCVDSPSTVATSAQQQICITHNICSPFSNIHSYILERKMYLCICIVSNQHKLGAWGVMELRNRLKRMRLWYKAKERRVRLRMGRQLCAPDTLLQSYFAWAAYTHLISRFRIIMINNSAQFSINE